MKVSRTSMILIWIVGFTLAEATWAAEYVSNWPRGVDRVWVGPEYWGNRLQDWRINDGRLECVESANRYPMRVLHLLTRESAAKPGTLTMSVNTGRIESGKTTSDTWTGFLIGSGGEDIDFRLTALAHHRPAEDGGLVAAIDGTGTVIFRDFSRSGDGGGTWAIGGPLRRNEARLLYPISQRGHGFADQPFKDVRLQLQAEPSGDKYTIRVSAHHLGSGSLVSEAVLEGVDPKQVDGGLALVSHRGPQRSGMGYWFRDWEISGTKVVERDDRRFGPVLCGQHTLSRGVLKLTAQMGPLGKDDTQTAKLQIRHSDDEPWRTVAEAKLVDRGYTFPFRVENWDSSKAAKYRVVYNLRTGPDSTKTYTFEGTIRHEPTDRDTFILAAFTGHKIFTGGLKWNHNGIWFPHNELVEAVEYHQPDLLFFSGDQVYEGDLTGAQRQPLDKAILDYLDKWYRWCWAFRDLARDVPCICIPDDHDVYHGNIWGAGGRHAKNQDDGGYRMDPIFVNMVQNTQTSHLPDPFDPTPVEQGITVYYTAMNYGGVSFAVIEDRKWKSSPTVAVPEGKYVNGWSQNPDFDPVTQADAPGAKLLGDRQLKFLHDWAADWSDGAKFKVALSQTIFSNVATLPGNATIDSILPRTPFVTPDVYPKDWKLAADGDSNGWPQTGRNKALRELRQGFALHVSGDQHLGSTTQYGVDDWRDAGYALCVPSIGNTWARRWYPPYPGRNQKPGDPPYAGDYKDGFGNRITVLAVSNPVISGREPSNLYDRAPGYGIVRLDKASRDITIEVWPRWVDPSKPDAKPYSGWPITIPQLDNYGRTASAYLPTLKISGMADPVVQVIDESNDEIVYTLRIEGTSFRPKVFRPGQYSVRIGDGEKWARTLKNVHSLSADQHKTLAVKL